MRVWKRYFIFILLLIAGHFFLESSAYDYGIMRTGYCNKGLFFMVVGGILWYSWHVRKDEQLSINEMLPKDPEEGWKFIEAKLKKERAEKVWAYTVFPMSWVFAGAVFLDLDIHHAGQFTTLLFLTIYVFVFVQLIFKEKNKILEDRY